MTETLEGDDASAAPGAKRSSDAAAAARGGRGDGEGALAKLREVLREQGGMIASLLPADSTPRGRSAPARLAASGPRALPDRDEYELLVEAIYEGYLLHYGRSRLLAEALEQDLALLAGDQLYALGLARLVRLGDLAAVAELADVITLCALAHGDGEPALAEAVWQAGARAIGWGGCSEHERAKQLARAGSRDALAAMRGAAAPRTAGRNRHEEPIKGS